MISFFDLTKQDQTMFLGSVLSWDGSFASIRNKVNPQPSQSKLTNDEKDLDSDSCKQEIYDASI